MKRWTLSFLAVLLPLSLHAQTFTPKVLVELFNNFDCAPCKATDNTFDQFMLDNNPDYGIVRLSIHNSAPDIHDEFYLDSKGSVDPRSTSFYNVQADPVGVVNGKNDANLEKSWEADCKSQALKGAPITVDAHFVDPTRTKIQFHFKNTVSAGVPVRAYIALTESGIVKANTEAEGVPLSGVWDDILRTILPSANGTDPFTATGNDEYTYVFDFDSSQSAVNTPWTLDNMQAVVFLQDDQGSSKKVEALGVMSLKGLAVAGVEATSTPSSSLRVVTNSRLARSQFVVSLAKAGHVSLSLSDMLGRNVSTVQDGMLMAGETPIQFNTASMPSGCYLARLVVDGAMIASEKMIVE